MYVVHFLLVDFGEGCRLWGICSMGCWGYVPLVAGDMFQVAGDMFCCDGGKTKSTPSPTDLD